ncbi:MAG: cation-transporting P-type ATPase [Nanoarchaeota archaeon]
MEKRDGLTSEEAGKLLETFGKNELKDIGKVSIFEILLRQIKKNFIIYLLAAAMIISFFVGKSVTAYTILGVIILVVFVGFIQEYKAEKSINALKKMLVPVSIVMRDGKETEIISEQIVPGDILVLRTGEKIPADCVVIGEKDLLLNESILTGESKEVEKTAAKNEKFEDKNTLFTGSFIVNGKCIARVIKTGMNTKFGKIAELISTTEKILPLQNKINHIAKYMSFISIFVAILTGGVILLSQQTISQEILIEVLILTIAIAVSAFPEGFPVVLITTLSLGAYRMAKKNAIVNRMSIIETLGETTVICSDKTGTITKGEMTIKKIYTDNKIFEVTGVGYEGNGDFLFGKEKINTEKENNFKILFKAALSCNDAIIHRTGEDKIYTTLGIPTEIALSVMAAKANQFKENLEGSREEEIPFSSERKLMSVLQKEKIGSYVYSKGALEILIKKCKYIQRNDGIFTLVERDRKNIIKINKEMTSNSLRTIALAYKKIKKIKKDDFENDLVFIGLVGMEDSPREGVKEAISICKKAGISIKMITGDNIDTALAIAREIGLEKGFSISGAEIDNMSDIDLAKVVKSTVVFARVKPEHKLRIVRALKENGEIVTMTGDGVNDSPALKEAHIGVAMGKSGTDVSRSVADLTLKDDNFATIVEAVKEGRTIFNNIRKFTTYQLSCNYAELSILFFGGLLAIILGWPIPVLLAIHILFMNIVTDNIPAITLGFNTSSNDVMIERPRKKTNILNKNLFYLLIFNGTLMAVFTLFVFYFTFSVLGQTVSDARTTTLVALIFVEIASAFNFRSFRKGVLNRSPFVNKYLVYASLISIIATIIIVYTPANKIFETIPIPLADWIISLGFAIALIIIFDVLKIINKKKNLIDFNN